MSTLSSNLSSLSTSPIVRKGALSSRVASSAASAASEPGDEAGETADWACPACGGGGGSGRVVRPCCAARVCASCDRAIGDPKPREVAGRAAGPYLFFAADDLHADEPPAPACPACGGAVLAATDAGAGVGPRPAGRRTAREHRAPSQVVAALERHAERDAPAALCALGALLQRGDALLGVARAPDRAAAGVETDRRFGSGPSDLETRRASEVCPARSLRRSPGVWDRSLSPDPITLRPC